VDNVAANRTTGGSVSLAWKVTEQLHRNAAGFIYQKSEYNGFPYSDHGTYEVPPPAVTPTNLNLDPNNFVQTRMYNLPEGGHDRLDIVIRDAVRPDRLRRFRVVDVLFRPRCVRSGRTCRTTNYQILGAPFRTPILRRNDGGTSFVQEVRFCLALLPALCSLVGGPLL